MATRKQITERPIVISHQTRPGSWCPDGAAAAWVVAKAHGYDVELHGEVYRQDAEWQEMYISEDGSLAMPYDPRDRNIIFVDWAGYPVELMRLLSVLAANVIILDHHKSRVEDLSQFGSLTPNFYYGYVPNELGCGATIAWDFYFPLEERPWFLKYVRSRDTNRGGYWQGKLPHHEAVNTKLSMLRKGKQKQDELFAVFDTLYAMREQDLDLADAIEGVEEKNRLSWAEVEQWKVTPQYINLADAYPYMQWEKEIDQEVLACADTPVPFWRIKNPESDRHYSWVGTYLSEVNPDVPFVVIRTSEKNAAISLRKPVQSEIDCSEIAACFGGGGHADAAGFPV